MQHIKCICLDIWGNTVNVASRMESTGKAGAIQVTQETCSILEKFGYTFMQRGLVMVKGKGELLTFYLQVRLIFCSLQTTITYLIQTIQGKGPKPPSTPPKGSGPTSPTIKTVLDTTATSDSPFHLETTTTSSSTASPNSVRLNQDYHEEQKLTQLTSNENTIQLESNGSDASSTKILHNNNKEINNSMNSNNINSNHVFSEKEALLQEN